MPFVLLQSSASGLAFCRQTEANESLAQLELQLRVCDLPAVPQLPKEVPSQPPTLSQAQIGNMADRYSFSLTTFSPRYLASGGNREAQS
jgi:hypothetical protein